MRRFPEWTQPSSVADAESDSARTNSKITLKMGIFNSQAMVSLGRRALGRVWIQQSAESAVVRFFQPFGILGPLEVTVHFVQRLFVVSVAVSFVGCAAFGTPENAQTPGRASFALPVWTTDGMYLVSGRSGALFLAASPLEWSHYRGVVVDDIEISTKDRSRDLTPYEENRLRGYFTRRLEKVFGSNGWPIVETPGEDVLRLRLAVRGLEVRRPRDFHFGTIIVGPSSTKITIVLELRDPATGDRRLLFGDKRALPFGAYAGSSSVSIRRIEDAFYEFSIVIRRRLAEVQRGAFPPPPRPS